MQDLAYVNGVFGPIEQAKVSINDRGLLYGDSVYEVISAHGGRPFRMEDHLERLRISMEALKFEVDFSNLKLESIIREGLTRCGLEEAMVYIQITRGEAPRCHVPPVGLKPNLIVTFRPLPPIADHLRERGASIMTAPEIRWGMCYIKATTLLPNVITRMQAKAAGYHDAIFVSAAGEVREGTSSNVVMVKNGRLYFPPRDRSILNGVTLITVLECAQHLKIACEERPILIGEVRSAEELFLTSTTEEILPVTQLDGLPIGGGCVGTLTRAMMTTYHNLARGLGEFADRLRNSA